jgi:hypothetical protein
VGKLTPVSGLGIGEFGGHLYSRIDIETLREERATRIAQLKKASPETFFP